MKQQLYIKNSKGRYEPYKEPKVEDNKLYRKVGNKYIPASMMDAGNDLQEGVWVVKRSPGRMSMTNSNHLRWEYQLENVSDLQNPVLNLNTAELGKLDKICEDVYFDNLHCDRSPISNFKTMVAEIIRQLTNKDKENG